MTEEASPLPPVLAEQAGYLASRLDLAAETPPDDLLRQVDAALLNLCEYAEADMDLLDAIMGIRMATQMLASAIEDPANTDLEDAQARVRGAFEALLDVLMRARPSAMSVAMGLGW